MGFDLYGKSGNYFRASVWAWRPILSLIDEVKPGSMDTAGWNFNDGRGLNSQQDCNSLAIALEQHVSAGRKEYIVTIPGAPNVNADGRFLMSGESGGTSVYRTDADHVLELVKFLRECGGSFEIF